MPAAQTALTPRKSPRQGRSRPTCEAILQAAARILERDGIAGMNTNRVAELAGVSVGSLYQYFPSKEAIAAELIRRMRTEMHHDITGAIGAVEGESLPVTVDLILRASMRHHFVHAERARALEHAESMLPLDAETAARKKEMNMMLADVLASHGIADPAEAACDLSALTRGMVNAATAAGESDFEAILTRVRRAVLGYLGINGPISSSQPR